MVMTVELAYYVGRWGRFFRTSWYDLLSTIISHHASHRGDPKVSSESAV